MGAAAPSRAITPERLEAIRADFPLLGMQVHGRPLVYLDNAATTQKPACVIAADRVYYESQNANIHRGVHHLSEVATREYEAAREKARAFLGASSTREVVFVRGATEGVNLVAQAFGRTRVGEGDEVLITGMEHHSNIVPWQLLCAEKGAKLRVVPITDAGELEPGAFESLLGPRVRMVAIVHVSNALGTVNPVRQMCAIARERGVPVLVDGAQAVPHQPVDVRDIGCDFYVFSGHKVFAPTGIGVLWGREALLESMPPWQGGGDMISYVTFEKTTYNDLPYKFEAGTPNIAGVIGLGAALDYVNSVGLDAIAAHERGLLDYATAQLESVPGARIVGTARDKAGVLSFTLGDIHPHDIGTVLDQEGVAIRTGHHCAQPVMDRFGIAATARASFAFYNTRQDIDAFVRGVRRVTEVFG